jgi:cobalt-zinc-cadmium efflux system membrane fusion protein
VLAPAQGDPKPTILQLSGTTDYVPDTVTIVRTRFGNCRVDEVLVDLGATVKRDDPLLKLFSTDLATAKSEYELACSQWKHDKRIYDLKAPAAEANTISKKELIDAEDNESQSRLKMRIAKDKLLGYGLSEEEISSALNENGIQKGTVILRSRGHGVVVKKSVVRGNYYDSHDELMVIAPLDHLYVRGKFSEVDAEKIELGQKLKVAVPFTDRTIDATVDYIDKAIDPQTGTATFRTRIPNAEGRIKAGQYVRVDVDLGPSAKSTRVTDALAERKSELSLDERLRKVERSLQRLIEENEGPTRDIKILERLNELERKLDRVLEVRAR